jgi:hypothetical protein
VCVRARVRARGGWCPFRSPPLWVSSQDDPEETGWWWGEKEDGTQGYLPCDYIRFEAEPEAPPQPASVPQHEDNQEKLSSPSLRSPRYFVLDDLCVVSCRVSYMRVVCVPLMR